MLEIYVSLIRIKVNFHFQPNQESNNIGSILDLMAHKAVGVPNLFKLFQQGSAASRAVDQKSLLYF